MSLDGGVYETVKSDKSKYPLDHRACRPSPSSNWTEFPTEGISGQTFSQRNIKSLIILMIFFYNSRKICFSINLIAPLPYIYHEW
jgi:hypothetical protein